MATSKSEFVDLANELINDEFADFRNPLLITKDGKYNPSTDTEEAGESYPMQAIPLDINSASRIFADATNESLYLVAFKGDTDPQALDSSYACNYDGKKYTIEAVENDPANAAWFFRLAK